MMDLGGKRIRPVLVMMANELVGGREEDALAREELCVLFDRPVHLFIHVTVDEKWADKREFYGNVGLDFDA